MEVAAPVETQVEKIVAPVEAEVDALVEPEVEQVIEAPVEKAGLEVDELALAGLAVTGVTAAAVTTLAVDAPVDKLIAGVVSDLDLAEISDNDSLVVNFHEKRKAIVLTEKKIAARDSRIGFF